jgi:proliferating cell nuclear antigen
MQGASIMHAAASVDLIETWLDPVDAIVDEAVLEFDQDGSSVSVVDPANVCLVESKLDGESWDVLDTAEGGTIVGVDLSGFMDVLSLGDDSDIVTISDSDGLTIRVGSIEFSTGVLDPDSIRDQPSTPDVELNRVSAVPDSELQRGVRAADLCSDHITVQAEEGSDELRLTAEGDVDEVDLTISGDDHEVIGTGAAASKLSLRYLEDVIGSMDGMVSLRAGEELPVEFRWSRADRAVTSEAMIAPRIE